MTKIITSAIDRLVETSAPRLTIDFLLQQLDLVKVTKRQIKISSGNVTQYVGYSRVVGGKLPQVEAVLKKLKVPFKYDIDVILAHLPEGITLWSYPPYKGFAQVAIRVPAASGDIDAYHKSVVQELQLDKLNTGVERWAIKKFKNASGQLRLSSSFTVETVTKGKANGREKPVLKAMKSMRLVEGKTEQTSDNETSTLWKGGVIAVRVITYTYDDVSFTKFILFTPGAKKDLP